MDRREVKGQNSQTNSSISSENKRPIEADYCHISHLKFTSTKPEVESGKRKQKGFGEIHLSCLNDFKMS